MYAEPSSINMSQGFIEVLKYTNNVTDQWISNIILICIYAIILMGFYKAKEDFPGALAVAGYGTFVISLLFWISGFISGTTFGIVIGIAVVGTVILLMDNS